MKNRNKSAMFVTAIHNLSELSFYKMWIVLLEITCASILRKMHRKYEQQPLSFSIKKSGIKKINELMSIILFKF